MDGPQAGGIVVYPDPVLRRPCLPVGSVGAAERMLAARICRAMEEAGGIGLAAPQVGVSARVFAMSSVLGFGSCLVMFDPCVVWRSEERATALEGCLSIPGRRFAVTRPASVAVSYLDGRGMRATRVLSGLAARCLQHEADHLDGTLAIDRGIAVAAAGKA